MCHRFAMKLSLFSLLVIAIDHAVVADDKSIVTNDAMATNVVINADSSTYDSHPSSVTTSDGTTWVAWHAYQESRDRILLKRIDSNGKSGSVHNVSESGTIHSPPKVVALGNGSIWVFWSAKTNKRWRILGRELHVGQWREIVTISDSKGDAIMPAAACLPSGNMIVTWSIYKNSQFQIQSCQYDGKNWHSSINISSDQSDAFRPKIAVDHNGETWVFWDHYNAKRYSVQGRKLLPKLGIIEQVSPKNQHCLMPTALATKKGVYISWVQKQDVIGGPGVISQRHTLHMAVRQNDDWEIISDRQGSNTAAELTQGLVAKIEPKPIATGGYMGRRVAPMLLENGNTIWLLWERKTDHRGSTPYVVGDLLGRPMQDGIWKETVLLHSGLVDYHLSHSFPTTRQQLIMLASQLPRNSRRVYHRLFVDIAKAKVFKKDEWTGWHNVELPIQHELTERRRIQVGEKTYNLYWADMHCHSALTCDAEGEQDELTHYARDRARLDVVVFTNNDFLYDAPLTEYEYALGNFFAQNYTRSGKFLSLPGYEWTSRVPGEPGAKFADPANWTAPFRINRSYPNHRSVVYPPSGGPLLRFPEVGNDIEILNNAVEVAGGVTFTQHEAFLPSGHKVEVGMELTSGWRNYITRVPNQFHEPLNKGARLGFVACGDSHRRAPGLSGALTGIYAENLSEKSILNALRQRRCFATNGSRILIDARANGTIMGQDVQVNDGKVTLNLRAIGTRPITEVVLIRDGKRIQQFKGNGKKTFNIEYNESDLSQGTHWYYWRISQDGVSPALPGNMMAAHGHLAWSTPHWVISN